MSNSKFWTRHKLTVAQLKVLASFIAEEQTGKKWTHKHGVASYACARKGLVSRFDDKAHPYPCCFITYKGRHALDAARREGW